MSKKINDENAVSNTAEAPLLESAQEEKIDKEATLSYREATSDVWKLSKWMILNALFHPIYSVVNAMVLGH